MLCQKCGKETLPVVESYVRGGFTDGGGGPSLKLVEFCQSCGERVMEKCPVCEHLHPIGSVYCATTGKSFEEVRALELARELQHQRRAEQNAERWLSDCRKFEDCVNKRTARVRENRVAAVLLALAVLSVAVGAGIGIAQWWLQPESFTTNIGTVTVGILFGVLCFLLTAILAFFRLVIVPSAKESGVSLSTVALRL